MLVNALQILLKNALQEAVDAGELTLEFFPDEIKIEVPRDASHGDYASNIAMLLAKSARRAPRQIAEVIVAHLKDELIESAEIAGPGFLNFRLSQSALIAGVKDVREQDLAFGQWPEQKEERYLLEFVSANPTGPLHFGHGRWAVLGDCIARLMKKAGYQVDTEFYINDAGSQIENLGASLQAAYAIRLKEAGVELPQLFADKAAQYLAEKEATAKGKVSFYHGEYLHELAEKLEASESESALEWTQSDFSDYAKQQILGWQKAELEEFGVHFDRWFAESELHAAQAVEPTLEDLKSSAYTYESEGALWFKSSELGDEKDRVLVKSDGRKTYFANDIAYHRDKYQRGYTHLINIWGADHHGYIDRVKASVQALGHSADSLEVLLGQLVNLYRNGEKIRMSKRTGEMVTFGEVFEEVGKDATRFLLMQRSADTMLDFDLDLAKTQSAENPVFYVQYAHARICSIFRTAAQSEQDWGDLSDADLTLLTSTQARSLILKLLAYPDEVAFAAKLREPHRLGNYVRELAALFHSFYSHCRILNEAEPELSLARMALADASRKVVRNVLETIFGISAPESM